MSVNKYIKYKKFNEEQEKLLIEYRKYGFSEESIKEMQRYDKQVFLGNLNYELHTKPIIEYDENEFFATSVFQNFIVYQNTDKDYLSADDIENQKLRRCINGLIKSQLELVNLLFLGYSVSEIAEIKGVSTKAINERIRLLKEKLLPIMENIFPDVLGDKRGEQ